MRSFKNVMMSSFVVLSMASVPVIAQPVEPTAGAGAPASAAAVATDLSAWAKAILDARMAEDDIFVGRSSEIKRMSIKLSPGEHNQLRNYGVTSTELKNGVPYLRYLEKIRRQEATEKGALVPADGQVLREFLAQLDPVKNFMEAQGFPEKEEYLIIAFREFAKMSPVRRDLFLSQFEKKTGKEKRIGLLYLFNQSKAEAAQNVVHAINADIREDWDDDEVRPVVVRSVITCSWAKAVLKAKISPGDDIFVGRSSEIKRMSRKLSEEEHNQLRNYGVNSSDVQRGIPYLRYLEKIRPQEARAEGTVGPADGQVLQEFLDQLNSVREFMEAQRFPEKEESLITAFLQFSYMPPMRRALFLRKFVEQTDEDKLTGLLYLFNQSKAETSQNVVHAINADIREDWGDDEIEHTKVEITCPWASEVLATEISLGDAIFEGKTSEIKRMSIKLSPGEHTHLRNYGVTAKEVKNGIVYLRYLEQIRRQEATEKGALVPADGQVLREFLAQLTPVKNFMEAQSFPEKEEYLIIAFREFAKMSPVRRDLFLSQFMEQTDANKLTGLLYLFTQSKAEAAQNVVHAMLDKIPAELIDDNPGLRRSKRQIKKEPTFRKMLEDSRRPSAGPDAIFSSGDNDMEDDVSSDEEARPAFEAMATAGVKRKRKDRNLTAMDNGEVDSSVFSIMNPNPKRARCTKPGIESHAGAGVDESTGKESSSAASVGTSGSHDSSGLDLLADAVVQPTGLGAHDIHSDDYEE